MLVSFQEKMESSPLTMSSLAFELPSKNEVIGNPWPREKLANRTCVLVGRDKRALKSIKALCAHMGLLVFLPHCQPPPSPALRCHLQFIKGGTFSVDCSNGNILLLILYYSYARCQHWWRWHEGCTGLVWTFLCKFIYNF